MPNYKINIPEPCHEKWGEMTPTERGAFCAVCKKDVVDFTGLTAVELRDYLRKTQALTCGKFTNTQLEADYSIEIEKPYSGWFYKSWLAAAAALFLSVFNAKAEAKNTPPIEWVEDKISGKELLPVIVDEPTDTGYIYIIGKVVDEKEEGLPFVLIYIVENDNVVVQADVDGNFKIKIPKELNGKSISISTKYLGYEHATTKLGVVKESNFKADIKLVLNPHVMGMAIIEINPPQDKAKRQAERFYFGVESKRNVW